MFLFSSFASIRHSAHPIPLASYSRLFRFRSSPQLPYLILSLPSFPLPSTPIFSFLFFSFLSFLLPFFLFRIRHLRSVQKKWLPTLFRPWEQYRKRFSIQYHRRFPFCCSQSKERRILLILLRVWVVVWVAAFALPSPASPRTFCFCFSCFSSLFFSSCLFSLFFFFFFFFFLGGGGGGKPGGVPLFCLECRYKARQGKASKDGRKGGSKYGREDG